MTECAFKHSLWLLRQSVIIMWAWHIPLRDQGSLNVISHGQIHADPMVGIDIDWYEHQIIVWDAPQIWLKMRGQDVPGHLTVINAHVWRGTPGTARHINSSLDKWATMPSKPGAWHLNDVEAAATDLPSELVVKPCTQECDLKKASCAKFRRKLWHLQVFLRVYRRIWQTHTLQKLLEHLNSWSAVATLFNELLTWQMHLP